MRFERISLRNFKCYEDASVAFDRGVTVIHGINGSGKSSLLEAGFFALYGATALDRTLEEIVTIGAEDAEVDLRFTHGSETYHLSRRIRATGERVTTASCVLEGPAETIEGVGDVEDRIVSMLRMDSEAFVNSAFVRQGEINKLINATPAERQRMIDRLLQLGKLETYRERAAEARLGIGNLLDHWAGKLESLAEQIDEKEGRDLHDRRAALTTEIADLEETIERYEENREEARETLDEAESVLETHEERQEELETVAERVADLRETIAEATARREDLGATIAEHRSAIEDLQDRIDELAAETDVTAVDLETIDEETESLRAEKERLQEEIMDLTESVQEREGEMERKRERAEELERQAAEKRERISELEAEVEALAASVEEGEDRITDIEETIEEHESAFEEAPVEFGEAASHLESLEATLAEVRETETAIRENLATARSRVTEAEGLLSEGKCPECGQPVEGSPHVESLDEYRERVDELENRLETVTERKETLESDIETAESLGEHERAVESLEAQLETERDRLAEKREAMEEAESRISSLEDDVAELTEEASTARETAAEAEAEISELRPEIGERNQRRSDIAERIDRLRTLRETVDERADLEDTIDRIEETRETIADRNDERREHLQVARERKQTLADTVDEDRVAEARAAKQRASEYLDEVERILEATREERDQRRSDLGAVENELSELENLRSQHEDVGSTVGNLQSLHEEVSDLEEMYGDLRAELRQQNVARLERLVNETFDVVYQNDSYARIELSGRYELTVYQKDGEPLEPEQLSGGERALFNLSLRTAIYRLLAEGIDGTAPMPPLILDEPTVFLDSGHVSQLVTLVESMREIGVEQIIVVSHDQELVGAADDVIRVAKDATTNRSYIEEGARTVGAD